MSSWWMSVHIPSQSNNNIRCRRTYWVIRVGDTSNFTLHARGLKQYVRPSHCRLRREAVSCRRVAYYYQRRRHATVSLRRQKPSADVWPPRRLVLVRAVAPPSRPPRRLSAVAVSRLTDPFKDPFTRVCRRRVRRSLAAIPRCRCWNRFHPHLSFYPWIVCLSFMFPANTYTCLHCCLFLLHYNIISFNTKHLSVV